jgi:hypothetical protein
MRRRAKLTAAARMRAARCLPVRRTVRSPCSRRSCRRSPSDLPHRANRSAQPHHWARSHTIDSGERLDGVVVPQHAPIRGSISADMAVNGAGQHELRCRSDGGRSRGAAIRAAGAGVYRRRIPKCRSCRGDKRVQSAACVRVENERLPDDHGDRKVGDRRIHCPAIRCRAPLHAAQSPPRATRVCHTIRPSVSGSSPQTIPDFWPIVSRRLPSGSVTRLADAPRS